MGWLWAIVVGLVLGLIAKAIIPGKQAIPLWLTIVYGIIGSVIGNTVATALHVNNTSGIDWIRHLLQLAGAVVVVALGTPLWTAIRGGRNKERAAR
jgi:uncharacterized membrane protein YeaQ/YmgE (transglycosylase-associated protein family)